MRTVERDVRRLGERTARLCLFIKNEMELAGLKEQDEDSKTLSDEARQMRKSQGTI